ncbi:calcium-binding protein [Neisseria sp. 83E34]|uniref:calcium-binding protein n=1 Tax=Neisseria sp. 83E34 TaxID=1692264 RepID=UPI0006CE9099|nr:calcium-binding protein [Neisseria sp. 83E34]
MSVTQWFEVNGYDSRKANEQGSFSTNKQSITFKGQVDPASTEVKIYTYRTAKETNGQTAVREYFTTVDKSQIKEDGTFTAHGLTEMSGDVSFELQAASASGNVTVTRIAGTVDGNNQSMQVISEDAVMNSDYNGNWHSYSRDIDIKGKVEPGSKNVRVKVDRENYNINDVDENGNFTLSLKDLNAGQHTFTFKSTDADDNQGKDVYTISTGRKYGGGAVVIDQDENAFMRKGQESLSGNVLTDYFIEKGSKDPGILGFSANGKDAAAGEVLTIDGVGTIQMQFNGQYVFKPVEGFSGRVPDITYHVANGTDTDYSVLSIRVNDTSGNAYTESLIVADNANGANNELQGRLVNDVLIGDTRNTFNKGTGDDTVVYTVKATNDTIEGNNGHDILFGDNISTEKLNFTAPDGSTAYEALRAYVEQNLDNNSDDAVRSFIAGNWSSLLDSSGNGGNDILRGEVGSDILIGGAGNDILDSGEGYDKYVFVTNSNSGRDVIKDFNLAKDKLVFTEALNDKNASWNDATHTLTFTGVKDGHTYKNTITFQNFETGMTLEDVLKTQEVLG